MIMGNEIVKSRLQKARVDMVIRPNISHIGPLDFGYAEECIKEGERATQSELGQINSTGCWKEVNAIVEKSTA